MKTVVTHQNPDLDAAVGAWLIKRFLPGWEESDIEFVPAGQTLNNIQPDSSPEILHVDTGNGLLDHHQTSRYTCAALQTLSFIQKERKGQPFSPLEEKALKKLVKVVIQVDNARDLNWPEAREDRFQFYLHSLVFSIKRMIPQDDKLINQLFLILDALLLSFKEKIRAYEEIKSGKKFLSPWGKALAVTTGNEQVLWEGEKVGFVLVLKYDPDFNRTKIYSRFDSEVDLTMVYNKLEKVDPQADWYLHPSKKLLLISSNPQAHNTDLTIEQLIDLLKK